MEFPANYFCSEEPFPPERRMSDDFGRRLLHTLAGCIGPGGEDGTWDAARELFFSLQPRTAVEGVLAARAVAAHHAMMNCYSRAARSGMDDATMRKLHAGAARASRSFDAALRMITRVKAPVAPAASGVQPTSDPCLVSPCDRYQPRDRYGNPIPKWRFEGMTMKQRRACFGYGATERVPEEVLVAEAIAEEEALIAAERARNLPQADPGGRDQAAT